MENCNRFIVPQLLANVIFKTLMANNENQLIVKLKWKKEETDYNLSDENGKVLAKEIF